MTNARTKTYLGLVVFACLAGGNLQAQVDLEFATYGTDSPSAGMAPVASGTQPGRRWVPSRSPRFIPTAPRRTPITFVTDASGVSNYVYVPIGGANAFATDPFTVGSTYTGLNARPRLPFGTACQRIQLGA